MVRDQRKSCIPHLPNRPCLYCRGCALSRQPWERGHQHTLACYRTCIRLAKPLPETPHVHALCSVLALKVPWFGFTACQIQDIKLLARAQLHGWAPQGMQVWSSKFGVLRQAAGVCGRTSRHCHVDRLHSSASLDRPCSPVPRQPPCIGKCDRLH